MHNQIIGPFIFYSLQTYAFIKSDLFLFILTIKLPVKNNKKLYGGIIHCQKFKVSTLCGF